MKPSEKIAAFAVGAACVGLGIAWDGYWTTNSAWTSFAGSIIGAAGALIGALIVVNYQRQRDREAARQHMEVLLTTLEQIVLKLEQDATRIGTGEWTGLQGLEAWQPACQAILDIANDLQDYTMHRTAGFDRNVFDLKQQLSMRRSVLAVVVSHQYRNEEPRARALASNISTMCEELRPFVRKAVAGLGSR